MLEALLRDNGIALPPEAALPEGAAAVESAVVPDGRKPPPPVAPGGEWRQFATNGQNYYYNPETGISQWDPPPQGPITFSRHCHLEYYFAGTQALATMQSDLSAEPQTVIFQLAV